MLRTHGFRLMDLLFEVKLSSTHLLLSKERGEGRGGGTERQRRMGFVSFLRKSGFPPLNSGALVFLSPISKIILPSLTIVWSLESGLFFFQKCSNGQISTAWRKGKIETVCSIIASLLPLARAVGTWPATIRDVGLISLPLLLLFPLPKMLCSPC